MLHVHHLGLLRITAAFANHSEYSTAHKTYVAETRGIVPGDVSSARGTHAIVDFLRGNASPCPAP